MRRRPGGERPDDGVSVSSPPDALSVGELTRRIRRILEGSFTAVRVHGEVVGLKRAGSGHIYFTLKDDSDDADAQIAAVLWRSSVTRLRFALEDGLRVVVEGRLAVYPPRGTYQIVAERVRPAGQGTLLLALERLRARLWQEGLFDPGRKRPIPFLPDRIALVTSPDGAAVHDVLRSIYRKFPAWVRLLPVRVQGEGAADDIVEALELLGRVPAMADVAILARGGGSLEDLWTFNEERVARAVAACAVPTICGVGHEIDVTLADLAADVRAQTPTHAGELVVPHLGEIGGLLTEGARRLGDALERRVERLEHEVDRAGRVLASRSPADTLERLRLTVESLGTTLQKTLYNRFREWEDQLLLHGEKLRALGPLDVVRRGYSLVVDSAGRVVRSVDEVAEGEELTVVLTEGELRVRVVERRRDRSFPERGPSER